MSAQQPHVTVQYSLIYNGWTVLCGTCRACLGTHGKQSSAEEQAEGHRLGHTSERPGGDAMTRTPWRCRLFGHDLPDVFINVYNPRGPSCQRCGKPTGNGPRQPVDNASAEPPVVPSRGRS